MLIHKIVIAGFVAPIIKIQNRYSLIIFVWVNEIFIELSCKPFSQSRLWRSS